MNGTLKREVTTALGLAPAEVSLTLRRPITYQSNRLYDLRAGKAHWIVKEYRRPDEFELAPRREYGSLERLESLDVAPRPVFLQANARPPLGPYVVYEYMPGRICIVDWEDSGLIDPALDLADLMVHANQEDLLSAGEWEAFLAPYLATRGTADPGLERRLALYQVLLSFLWLSILLSRGVVLSQNSRLNEWLINKMPANQRLRRYLARVLVRPRGGLTGQLEELSGLTFFPVVESDV
jgi:aminoglycoside phosphotransferase (APT) family kinase protein